MNQLATQRLHVHIRWAIRRDLTEVFEIENLCFEHPWSEEDFIRCLRQHNCICMVAEAGERIVGFMVYELRRTRLILMNLAVLPSVQRRGVATAMIAKLKAKLSPARRTCIVTDVRESNLDAQLFMRAVEFRAVEVVPDAYEVATEDAYVFRYQLPKSQVKS